MIPEALAALRPCVSRAGQQQIQPRDAALVEAASPEYNDPMIRALAHTPTQVKYSLKDSIANWLLRSTPSVAVRHVVRPAAVIGSSRGRVRGENQDKAVTASFESENTNTNFRVFIVCDGLGGMQEGERCAAEAVGHFLSDLVQTASNDDREYRLRSAMDSTNREVWKTFREQGGTTLAAVLLTDSGATAASVGDTRIYKQGEQGELSQLTVDDTIAGRLAELTNSPIEQLSGGPFGHHLAQIIGQSSPVVPQMIHSGALVNGSKRPSDAPRSGLLIASDGAYRVGKDLLDLLARHATSARELVQRVISVSEWIGGDDNATAMYISLHEGAGRSTASRPAPFGLQIHDAFGELHLIPTGFAGDPARAPIKTLPSAIPDPTPRPRSEKRRGGTKTKRKGKRSQSPRTKAERGKEPTQPELDIKVTQQSE